LIAQAAPTSREVGRFPAPKIAAPKPSVKTWGNEHWETPGGLELGAPRPGSGGPYAHPNPVEHGRRNGMGGGRVTDR
jgi:hypothetical protein